MAESDHDNLEDTAAEVTRLQQQFAVDSENDADPATLATLAALTRLQIQRRTTEQSLLAITASTPMHESYVKDLARLDAEILELQKTLPSAEVNPAAHHMTVVVAPGENARWDDVISTIDRLVSETRLTIEGVSVESLLLVAEKTAPAGIVPPTARFAMPHTPGQRPKVKVSQTGRVTVTTVGGSAETYQPGSATLDRVLAEAFARVQPAAKPASDPAKGEQEPPAQDPARGSQDPPVKSGKALDPVLARTDARRWQASPPQLDPPTLRVCADRWTRWAHLQPVLAACADAGFECIEVAVGSAPIGAAKDK